ncbi:HpaII family restriction endonuclease [Tenacibaculum soleae]|uniref:HpaII family restriction endonuclease n=1 Tax=Tenacibaculum soleae TaxID=447689 RepID=UPI0026E47C47|nr:HpaII family restriction endonuclease [Tenacibaculum soleae]MDO6745573.1 HpaII family restriction endonuclease [Tenacibaculum soleae]|tara:strand:- start:159 stop:1238 length:1080 start_codon:yes stop_codon:yes gene_type:complete
MITGNKGEWSEIYTLFKLLGDKQLFLGNKEIEKLEGIVYPILRVLRTENNGDFEYSIKDEIILISGGEEVLKIAITEFKEKAKFLLEKIKSNKERTFSVPEIEEFMQSINCISLKASSTAKTDITIVVHDQRTNQQPTLGFSIKSQLGSPSTLLNAGKTTNFIFKISNLKLSETEINKINSIDSRSKIMDRINSVLESKGKFHFVKTEKQIFSNNLILIDSKLPEILSQVVYEFYSSKNSSVSALVENTNSKNPLNFDISNEHKFYEYKIKRFLTDVALGMMPSKVWTGQYDATGGYLIVKESGDILCYHIYNRNEFEDYLFNNTKLDTASSSRHDFGTVYKENGELYFKLNLQIRFTK